MVNPVFAFPRQPHLLELACATLVPVSERTLKPRGRSHGNKRDLAPGGGRGGLELASPELFPLGERMAFIDSQFPRYFSRGGIVHHRPRRTSVQGSR
jgi:hypothetical protein